MKTLIKNGFLVDPVSNINEVRTILIEDGIVKNNRVLYEEAYSLENDPETNVIDAQGLYVIPGLVDLHVHFRDPGLTHKETIETGSRAAARGGVTTVCPMPNTKPVADSVEVIRYEIEEGEKYGLTHILPVASVTKGQLGKEINDIKALKEAGAIAVSEDGKSVMDVSVYREALKICAEEDMLVMAHCEDINLVQGGVITAGEKQKELGLKGISNAVEDVITARDIFLAQETGARLHICHCSTEGTVELKRMADRMGIKISTEVCPHHFVLCDENITADDSNFKMNPPLRSRRDKNKIVEGIVDGTMTCISTDHAPHSEEEKKGGFNGTPFGIVGLETSFALSYTYLVKSGLISLSKLVEKMSCNPAKVIGIDKGCLANGKAADIAIVDLNNEFTVKVSEFASMGKNAPFNGYRLYGKVKYTLLDGKVVYKD